ncbi:MAG: antitermination protein NusG [Bacteroidetes bacterium]|nr:MAG: antitermination protein NusG [Bacteroidota bacterium]
MHNDKRWYALYTKPRWEKKVHQFLQEKGMESYCPLNKVRKKWSDRYKVVNEPLFKSYVFVKLKESEQSGARMIGGVVNFVYWNGKPAHIREEEILLIRKFLNEYESLEVAPISFSEQQKVKFSRGVLMDEQGIITRVDKNKIQVMLTSLGYKLIATVNKQEVIPLQD